MEIWKTLMLYLVCQISGFVAHLQTSDKNHVYFWIISVLNENTFGFSKEPSHRHLFFVSTPIHMN